MSAIGTYALLSQDDGLHQSDSSMYGHAETTTPYTIVNTAELGVLGYIQLVRECFWWLRSRACRKSTYPNWSQRLKMRLTIRYTLPRLLVVLAPVTYNVVGVAVIKRTGSSSSMRCTQIIASKGAYEPIEQYCEEWCAVRGGMFVHDSDLLPLSLHDHSE